MNDSSTCHWLWRILRPYYGQIALGIAVSIAVGVVATLDPLLMRLVLDECLPQRLVWRTFLYVTLIALCFVGRSALGGVSSLLSFRVTQRLSQDLRSELLTHMTNLSADWHEKTLLGQKVTRIEQDVDQISQYGSDVGNTIVRSAVFFVVNIVIMLMLSWQIAVALLPLLPLFFWLRLRFRNLIQDRADRAQAEIGNAAAHLTEHLAAVPQVQLLGAEDIRLSKTIDSWLGAVSAQWLQRRAEVAFSIAVTSVLAAGILFVLGLGARQYFVGLLSIGSLVAFYSYATRIFEPISSAMELYARTERMLASARRLRQVLDTEPSVPDTGSVRHIESPLRVGLSCHRLTFAYGTGRSIFADVNLYLRNGERIALVGKSGSGKSTLSRIMVRLADPTSGQVRLEHRPHTDYSLRELRRIVSYVPQHPVLFSGSIRDNLLLANPHASPSEVQTVIEVAQLLPVIESLDHGLDTALGADAVGISGGEKQRVAVARALLRRPEILILDESTSALDLPTENALFKAIAAYRNEMAMILISHRLRSLTWTDRIIVLDAGRVVSDGTHEELYQKSELYRELYERGEMENDPSSVPPLVVPVVTR